MEPVAVLLVMPVLIGVAAERLFRDARSALLAASLGAALVVGLCVKLLDPVGGWSWLAAAMVSPLPIALAVGTALICHGQADHRRRRRGHP